MFSVRSRRPAEFAPPSRQSLIPPSAGANLLARKAPWARPSLRLPPVKALFHRRQAQTLWREKRRAPVRVCASLPSKPYSTVGRRKPFSEKGAVRPPEFAPPSRQSLIPPSAGANPLARKAPWARLSLRLPPVKALFHRRQAQTLWREKRRAPTRVCASLPSKPYLTVGRRKPPGAPLLFSISSCNYHTVVYNDRCILALK